jgi:uncharacterized protein YjhX (UPF0386 family)
MSNSFHVAGSQGGYRVELYQSGKPYVTFVDGLTREAAEQEACSLERLWQKIKIRRDVPSSLTAAASSVKD